MRAVPWARPSTSRRLKRWGTAGRSGHPQLPVARHLADDSRATLDGGQPARRGHPQAYEQVSGSVDASTRRRGSGALMAAGVDFSGVAGSLRLDVSRASRAGHHAWEEEEGYGRPSASASVERRWMCPSTESRPRPMVTMDACPACPLPRAMSAMRSPIPPQGSTTYSSSASVEEGGCDRRRSPGRGPWSARVPPARCHASMSAMSSPISPQGSTTYSAGAASRTQATTSAGPARGGPRASRSRQADSHPLIRRHGAETHPRIYPVRLGDWRWTR